MTTTTKRLLACGAVGGPLFVGVVLAQALTRPGFDLTHQAASMLSIGSDGWIQIANFLATGTLALACATGLRRVLRAQPGGTWSPRLLYIYGAGLVAGGLFHPDAGDGFPPGTPTGQSVVRTWHGGLHMISGSLAFLALIALCFVLARTYAASGRRRSAITSRTVGGLFAICLIASGAPHGSLTLFVGAAIAMLWIALTAARLTSELPVPEDRGTEAAHYPQPARLPA
jgi:Protein of unknown function (DUF998)